MPIAIANRIGEIHSLGVTIGHRKDVSHARGERGHTISRVENPLGTKALKQDIALTLISLIMMPML